jgi:hypothetical protein
MGTRGTAPCPHFSFGILRAITPVVKEGQMKTTEGYTVKKTFLDIPNAAELAGFSVRHFRRIIEEERIRIVQIGRKFFILGADFERWQAAKKAKLS